MPISAGAASLGSSAVSAIGGLASALMTDTTGIYNASYNTTYAKASARRNAWEKKHQGELSVTAARLRSVKTRTMIGLRQDEAEARVKLNAATAGVGGDSVANNIYQTEANASYRRADAQEKEQSEINSALSEVYSGDQASRIPTDKIGSSMMGSMFAGLGSLDKDFFSDLGLGLEESGLMDGSAPEMDTTRAELYEPYETAIA